LFSAYHDFRSLKYRRIVPKIFLRVDIWKRISSTTLPAASHNIRFDTIIWDEKSLLKLIVSRALYNQELRAFYGYDQNRGI
jgi:hypothetical protein